MDLTKLYGLVEPFDCSCRTKLGVSTWSGKTEGHAEVKVRRQLLKLGSQTSI